MADNLNVTNNQTDGDESSPINEVPNQSPLEQSIPAGNFPDGTGQPPAAVANGSLPPATPPAPQAPETPVAGSASVPPPVGGENLGESATPPSTDEFLNSVLEQQPQVGSSPATTEPAPSIQTEPAPPINQPLEPKDASADQVNAPLQAPPVQTDQSSLSLEGQIQAPTQSEPAPAMPAPAPTDPMQAPQTEQRIQDDVALGGVQAAPVVSQTPQVPQNTDAPVSGDVFSDQPPQGGSAMKKIILAVLALVIIGAGYYAYTAFSSSSKQDNSLLVTATPAANAISDTTTGDDVQRKTDLQAIQDALLNYYAGAGTYPVSNELLALNKKGNVVEKALVPEQLAKLPTDPDSTKYYAYKSDGFTFTLSAVLDNSNDAEAVIENGKVLYKLTSTKTTTPASAATATAASGAGTYPPVPPAVDSTSTATSVPSSLNSNF
ncbi:MAG: hypothetical protein ABIJ72_03115 [bacterium]